jgi:electron transport complex protein RnfD
MMLGVFGCLVLTAVHFAVRYDPFFAWRFSGYVVFALALEVVYVLLRDWRLRLPRASTAVTTALLVLSVPSRMAWNEVGSGILVAVLFGKLMVDRQALRLNPMLVGRLFMMLVFADSIQRWPVLGSAPDVITSATPLGLYAAEGVAYSPLRILAGDIGGDWEGVYAVLPGSPGEVMPLLAMGCGMLLCGLGILDWRPGIMFLAGFAATCPLLGMPVGFHLAAGSVVFTAVYIVTDPRSMPGSKFGRLASGFLAGVINAWVRRGGYYPEGVVVAVLAVNLLSPSLDRVAFTCRGLWLRRNGAGGK